MGSENLFGYMFSSLLNQHKVANGYIFTTALQKDKSNPVLINQLNNATPENSNYPEKIYSSKYYETEEMHSIAIPHKNKLVSLFHINTCSLNKNFDDFQHLLSLTKKIVIIAISRTRITKQVLLLNNLDLNNYSIEFTPTETSAGGILLYIVNHLSYKCLNIYKK